MRLAKEIDVDPGGSLTRLATEDYVDVHSGPPAFDPHDGVSILSTDILTWLEADNEAIGGEIVNWQDQGTLNKDAAKVSGTGPTNQANKINGLPGLYFDGAKGMKVTSLDMSALSAYELIVLGIENTTGNEVMLEHGVDNNSDWSVHAGQGTGDIVWNIRNNGGGQGNTLSLPAASQPNLFYMCGHTDKTIPGVVQSYADYIYGSNYGKASQPVTAHMSGLNSNSDLYIGGRTGSGIFWHGWLSLIVVLKKQTKMKRLQMDEWVRTKYALPTLD